MSENEIILKIENLHAGVENREILKGVNLTIRRGEIHAVMGPNGSGKSTLSYVLMGHPKYTVTQGRVLYKGKELLHLKPHERAKQGLFLAFQYPTSVPGVNMVTFLRTMLTNVSGKAISAKDFRQLLTEKMQLLEMDKSFAQRSLNDGFSGGEKKRSEILQLALLNPEMAVLDETDSGLDIDALRTVCDSINKIYKVSGTVKPLGDSPPPSNASLGTVPKMGLLIITHYQRMLNYIKPDVVHVMVNGQIAKSGGAELALELEQAGYDAIVEAFTANAGIKV